MEKKPVKYCVISHTHWDREWYMPLEHMKLRLTALFDNLLKILDTQPDYIFHMDAQTIVLEDYLNIKPKNRGKIEQYVRQGRLLIGPWYVQNDFYLSSGEATVRNLLIGREIAVEFGKCEETGYCPDQFGNIAQLPQIFNQFGMRSCVFGRGRNLEPRPIQEFYWQSEDGSKVFSSYMTHWYNNAQRFSADIDRSMQMLRYIRENTEKVSAGDHYLLMNGVDHLEAQEDLLPILKELQTRLPAGDEIYQGTLDGYMRDLEAALGDKVGTAAGEMRDGNAENVLAGTLSSRVYLKQANDRCQMLLERQLEPLYSLLAAQGIKEYPAEYLRYLWKLLLENLAHDSICGCSTDAVHRHMEDRYERIQEGAERMLMMGMDVLQSYVGRSGIGDGDYLITLFNPVQAARSPLTEVLVEILESEDLGTISIRDTEENSPKFQVISRERKAKGLHSPINLPGAINVIAYRIQLLAEDLPGMAWRTYVVTPCAAQTKLPKKAADAPAVLENKYLRAVVNRDGTVDVTEKESGNTCKGLLAAEDTADVGDSYIFRAAPGDAIISSVGGNAETEWLQRDAFIEQLAVTVKMEVPAGYDFEKNRRRSETVPCVLRFRLCLEKESRRLDVRLTFDNRAKDHRLRLKLPTGADTDLSYSGNPFDCVCRSRAKAHGGYGVFDQPFSEYAAAGGLALFGKGLHEYEHGMDGALYVTVLRATGFITRDVSQDNLVEDGWRVPGNQSIGETAVELALRPYCGGHVNAGIPQEAIAFGTPVLAAFQPADTKKFSGGRPFVQGTDIPEFFYVPKEFPGREVLPAGGLFTLQGEGLVLSAVKLTEAGGALLVRVYNASSQPAAGTVCFAGLTKAAYASNLKEEELEKLPEAAGKIELSLRPKEINTLLVKI